MKRKFLIALGLILSGLFLSPVRSTPAGTFYLDYSTYLGGSGDDRGYALAVGSDRRVYLAGATASSDFPTAASWQAAEAGGKDAYLAAFSADGGALIFSTYLGGAGTDRALAVIHDLEGAVFLAGVTASADFPTLNPFQAAFGGGSADAFLARFDLDGGLLLSSYLGGGGDDTAAALACGPGGVYLTGATNSADFPTLNPYQAARPSSELSAFLSRFNSAGTSLLSSTYLGGTREDRGNDLAVGPDGSVYLAGYTESDNFPTANAYQANYGGSIDAFFTRFSADGSSLLSSSYLGGANSDRALGVAVGGDGSAFVAGNTFSRDFPTHNPFQAAKSGGSYDLFVSRVAPSGLTLIYSTYLGGSGLDYLGGDLGNGAVGKGLALDDLNRAYLAGFTASTDFPIRNPFQAPFGGGSGDSFLSVLEPSGDALFLSTYLGGSGWDSGFGVASGPRRWAYLAGATSSTDFPTAAAFQPGRGGGIDAFLARLKWITPTPSVTPTPSITPTPSVTPTPTPSPSITATPSVTPTPKLGFSQPPLYLRWIDDAKIGTTRSSHQAGWTYYFRAETVVGQIAPGSFQAVWGLVEDKRNDFNSQTQFSAPYQLMIHLLPGTEAWNIQAGDWLDLTYDGGRDIRIYLPEAVGTGSGRRWYPDERGNTYSDYGRKSILQSAPAPWILDYNRDGRSDIAVFRPLSGLWAIRGVTRVYFGGGADLPVPGNYAGDGVARIGVFRPTTGLWAVRGLTRFYFGGGGDLPVPGDYSGDGTSRAGIFRPASGLWVLRGLTRVYFGAAADIPAAGHYGPGPGRKIGIFRPASGLWVIRDLTRVYFGSGNDEPVPGDYGGTGFWSPAVFRPAAGLWAVRSVTRAYFGAPTDQPRPGSYGGVGRDNIAVFRPASGLWAVRDLTRTYFGSGGDLPVAR